MPNYAGWVGASKRDRTWRDLIHPRPTSVGVIIGEKPTSIVVVRGSGADLAAQTVRIDVFGSSSTERQIGQTGGGYADVSRVLVTGYKDHPTITNTDLRYDDRFADADGHVYRVVAIEASFPDRLLAVAEAET